MRMPIYDFMKVIPVKAYGVRKTPIDFEVSRSNIRVTQTCEIFVRRGTLITALVTPSLKITVVKGTHRFPSILH